MHRDRLTRIVTYLRYPSWQYAKVLKEPPFKPVFWLQSMSYNPRPYKEALRNTTADRELRKA